MTALTSVSAACGCTCQKPPLPTRCVRPSARSRTNPRPWTRWMPPSFSSTRSTETGLSSSTRGRRAPGRGVRMTWRSWEPVAAIASMDSMPVQSRFSMPSSETPGAAIMQCSTGSTSCERWRRRPAFPVSGSTAYCTRVRHCGTSPAGSLSPSAGMTVPSQPASSGVRPARRWSCSAMTSPLRRRCAPGLACCQSQPPQRPGPAVRAGRLDAVLGRLDDGDRVGAQEAGAFLAVRDAGHDLLAGQRVPDEQDLALVRAGDAVATVGDGADLDLVLLPDQRLLRFCLHGGGLHNVRKQGTRRTAGQQPTSLRGCCPAARHTTAEGVSPCSRAPSGASRPGRGARHPARSSPGACGPASWRPRTTPAGRAPR